MDKTLEERIEDLEIDIAIIKRLINTILKIQDDQLKMIQEFNKLATEYLAENDTKS